MRKLIRGFEVEVVECFEREGEVGVLVTRLSDYKGEFWVVRKNKREVLRLIVKRIKALGADNHAKTAVVEVKLGRDVSGLSIVRVIARENHAEVDEFGVRKNINGRVIAGFEMTVEKPEEWRARKGGFGKLYFHALKELKARLEMITRCKACDRGEVVFKKVREGQYVATWNQVRFAEHGVCKRCWEWMHPLRNHFNPHPELDDDGQEFDNIFCDCMTEPHRVNREELLENIEYWSALDVQESRKFLGTGTDECFDNHTAWVLSQRAE